MANAHAPATAKGRATRERIVRAAAEVVTEKGIAGMSLDDVRARTGASRSQLYHYFEDRDDLVHALIDVTTDAVPDTQGELLYQARADELLRSGDRSLDDTVDNTPGLVSTMNPAVQLECVNRQTSA